MNVLFLTHRLPYPPNRGDRIRSYHLLRQLASWADVSLLSLVHSDDEERLAAELRAQIPRVETARVPRPMNLLRAAAALPTSTPLTHVLLDSPGLQPALTRIMRESPPDVVLAYCSGMARLAMQPPLDRLPFVLDMVDVDSAKWETLGHTAPIPVRYVYRREARCLRAFEREATTRAHATLVVNEREKAAMLAVNPSARVEVIWNGIDVDTFRPREAPAPSADVVFCGVFNYGPNEEAALWMASEVWPLVRKCRADATLTLVGLDPSRQVRALSSTPGINVTGAVPDVRPYLWRAAASVAPLLVARGLQNKVLEAIAADLPCVVTPQVADGLPADVLPACRVARDPQAFATALLDLLALGPAARRAEARRASIAKFTWEDRLRPLPGLLRASAGITC